MLRKNLIKIISLAIILISLIVFVLAESKAINLEYPWHAAILYAIGAIGLVNLVQSVRNKKMTSFGIGFLLFVGFFIYFIFVTLKLENVLLEIGLIAILIVLLYLIKYLFNIRSDFRGENKSDGYKNYKERRKEEALEDLTKTEK